MGRLNYSARKIDGIKAAQVVARDLKKRVTPGSGARNTSRDPTLEIDLSDKNLTDDGFEEFIDALLECMKFRDPEHPEGAARVTELHLRGNQLTLQSLEKLTEVIALSVGDLREFDLSHNRMELEAESRDPAQTHSWFAFLQAFDGCYVLKKVDFGHNKLGLNGLEMLARAFMQSELDFVEGELGDVNGEEDEDIADGAAAMKGNGRGHKENDSSGRRSKKSPSKDKAKQNGNSGSGSSSAGKSLSPIEMKRFACTRGLRSVPFIIVSNTSLTIGAAVHLASMIMSYRGPDQLLSFLPGGKIPSLPDMEGRCNGLIWLPNDDMGDLGHKMLDSAETIRRFTSEIDPEEDQLHREGKLPRDLEGINLVDLMEQRRQHTKLNLDFVRIAKRARLEALRTEGVHATEIWSAALRMITAARTVLLDTARRDVEEHSEPENEHEDAATVVESDPVSEDQNGGPPSSSPVSNASLSTSASMSMPSQPEPTQPIQTQAAHAQPAKTQPGPTSANPGPGHGKKYVPFDYHSVDQELLLPTYPIAGSMQLIEPDDDLLSVPNGVKEILPFDLAPGAKVDVNGYSTAVQSIPDGGSAPKSGPFQPGATAFETNFPALSPSNINKEPVARQQTEQTTEKPQSGQPNIESTPQSTSPAVESGTAAPAQEQTTPEKKAKEKEKRNWRYELPFQVWCKIIAYSAEADNILNPAQQETIVRYATDWKSIAAELRSQGAEKHQQIWKLLDSVNCFTYG